MLEIAIAVSIMGIISGIFITKQTSMNRMMRTQKTKLNIEATTAAIASFLACNGRIPRPAHDSGIESQNTDMMVGKIPYNTLGISEKSTVDGDSFPLIYVVDPKLTVCKSIYSTEEIFDDYDIYFCEKILAQQKSIVIKNQSDENDIVAFVLDTKDNAKNHITDFDNQKIEITPSTNTFWIRRNVLLIQYLKMSPHTLHAPQRQCESTFDVMRHDDPFE